MSIIRPTERITTALVFTVAAMRCEAPTSLSEPRRSKALPLVSLDRRSV